MSVSDEDKRNTVLKYLRVHYSSWGEAMRNLPNFIFQDPQTMETTPISPNDAIREVEHNTEMGQKIVAAQWSKLQRLQP
jgi:hypothetical protein